MNVPRLLTVGILAALLSCPLAARARTPARAILYSLTGEASLTVPGAARRPLRLFERLPAGTVVEAGAGARLALAFANGKRYQLSGPARATLGQGDLTARAGGVRPLPSFPPLPPLAAIAEEDRPGPRAGAVRIRHGELDGLCPRDGAATLADATVLRFRAAPGAARHQVEIEDARGVVKFHLVTQVSKASVPAGVLAPGAPYHWAVTALDKPGPTVRGEADFVTLPRKAAAARERLRQAVEAAGDGGAQALLAAVDHGLGLVQEECDDSRQAAGVVVESVTPGSPGKAAGLASGDLILSWSCATVPPACPPSSNGTLRGPYELLSVEWEEAPRRAVILRGRRGDQEMAWTLTAGEWGLETRPNLPDSLAAPYLRGKAEVEAGDLAAAGRSWRAAAEAARSAGDDTLAAWLLDRLARALGEAGQWPEADAACEEAVAALTRRLEEPAAARLLGAWGKTFERRGAWNAATERYRQALAIDRQTSPKSLAEAWNLNALGVTAAKSGDSAGAETLLQQALAIREELAPGTAEVSTSLNNLGFLAYRLGDLAAAEEYLARGEALQQRIAPGHADHALLFQNLGRLAMARHDLRKAEDFYQRALAIFASIAPEGQGVADCSALLADVARLRGDLALADDLLRRSLALQERLASDSLAIPDTLIRLGHVAARRGDLEAAELFYRRALALSEKVSPGSWTAALSLDSLGALAVSRGDSATARGYLERSLAISGTVVSVLEQLGRVEMNAGQLAKAEDLFQRALALLEKQAPESLDSSLLLRDLGQVNNRRGRLAEAIEFHRRALDLQQKLAPATSGEAEALHFLGGAEWQAGRAGDGIRNICRSIDILDRQRARLGGTPEAKAAFEASLADYYRDCLAGRLALGQPAEAFHVLERGRARSFLALLGERDLRLTGLPPELAAERRRIDVAYDRAQAQLAGLSARDGAEIDRLSGELRDLRTRQEEIVARLRRESARAAALESPEPLDLAAARAALDPGTVLLEYAVGPRSSWVFVVQPASTAGAGLAVLPLGAGAPALRDEVASFRRLLERPTTDRAALRAQARRLYALLVRPAEARIAKAQRLLISPDGPLHTLPFAALMGGSRYLVERRPIHYALSATVYAELKRARKAKTGPGPQRLAAFGDPLYPQSTLAAALDPEVREALRRGADLKPLPATREEVESLVALYPGARSYLGRDATEEKAKSIGREANLVHFACHGVLDERFPLNSALALTLPERPAEGQDNGLLQAWEIFESVRLDADLVTLSACDTALGKEMGGEGLVGLTRAFQFAGARTVLASLWSLSDVSTARFMARFYGYLQGGKPKDEALRAAQIDQIRETSGSSHPFHWAAFGLFGDWR